MDPVFIGNLPTYAAIAWQFEKVPHKPANQKAFLDEVRAYARGPYAEALAQGHNLSAAQVDATAAKLASHTGLSVQYIKEANLRVSPARFRKELLRDQRVILGRYDARFEGTDMDAAGETPGYDPSDAGIEGAFVTALHDYLDRELKYTSNDTYYPSGPGGESDVGSHAPSWIRSSGRRSGPRRRHARCLTCRRLGRRDPEESPASRSVAERALRSRNALLCDRVRSRAR